MATLRDGGPTGGFFRDRRAIQGTCTPDRGRDLVDLVLGQSAALHDSLPRRSQSHVCGGGDSSGASTEALWPIWTPDGQRVAFTWLHHGRQALVYACDSERGTASPVATGHDGREMYFYSDRPGSAASDIYVSTRPNLSAPWSTPLNLSVANSAPGDAHPALSADGTMLVFNSGRPGGYGAHDLYVMTRTKGQRNH